MNELLISRVPLFAALPQTEIQHLAATLRSCAMSPSSILFHEGEYGDRFYIVLDGQIEIVKALGTMDERLLEVAGPGAFLGEMSLLNPDGLRTASARARSAVQLLEMTRADFDALLHRQPTLVYVMARTLSARLVESNHATIQDLHAKNRELAQAYRELQAAQAQIIEKQMLERELALAREIQLSMLPRTLPQVAGFDFGALMIPARAVGGDLFDFIPLDGDRLGIVVGDVMGKGVAAALFMASTRSLLREEALRSDTPQAVLESVNWHLLQMNDAGVFVTVLYGVLDPTTRDFVYVRAGHERPLIIDSCEAEIEVGPGEGQPLAILPDPELDEQTVSLVPGSTLLLYTDGVTEAMNVEQALFGSERLQEVLRNNCDAPAQTVCNNVLQAVRDHQGVAPQADDITLVALHVE